MTPVRIPISPSEPQKPVLEAERARIRAEVLAERIGLADGLHRPSDDFEGCTE